MHDPAGVTRAELDVVRRADWEVVRLTSAEVVVEVLPGKGGDILSVRWRDGDIAVLWSTPWGLRDPATIPVFDDSQERFLASYPGGWQTLFPNGGTACGDQPFHGEATMAAWGWAAVEVDDGVAVVLTTTLALCPFRLRRTVHLSGVLLTVTEEFTSTSAQAQQAMWSHHPAFGAPFLDASCRLTTSAGAFLADPGYDTAGTDLAAGARSGWPLVAAKDGTSRDLSIVPDEHAGIDRFGYLLDLAEPWYALSNPTLGLTATVRWDADVFPYAWYWLDVRGTTGPPWHGQAYVLAVEPASSYPGAGLDAAHANGTAITFAPGQTRRAWVSLELGASRR